MNNPFHTILNINNQSYNYYSLTKAKDIGDFSRLPKSLKILLENLLRYYDNASVNHADLEAMYAWLSNKTSTYEIAYRPARVLMQDFTGVPAIVDLAAMRTAMAKMHGDPEKINPLVPVDLVIDHSVQVDSFGHRNAFIKNVELEMHRNFERYQFLRWGQTAFKNFRVVPPGTGICHQVNLEYLAKVVWQNDNNTIYPDTLVGTDSHTTMINGLSVLGWGVGGIEAEAAMLGQPISMVIPEVIGVKLTGKLCEGIIATDLVLTITEILRKRGVVGKFVEFFGPGLDQLPLADRATIANMAPEYGATCGFFPVDQETINYLKLTGRNPELIELVIAYAKAQGLWRESDEADPVFTEVLEINLDKIVPSLAGPKRPQDRVAVTQLKSAFEECMRDNGKNNDSTAVEVKAGNYKLTHGAVVIAAITSCTNTSNPSALVAAGLLAQNALKKGLKTQPWVKTSLAPGSKVVTEYLEKSHLQESLDQLGFNLVGYGCTTCIGNSGPLPDEISTAINQGDLVVSSVLSGNRNFEGRVHPLTKANWLASPALVVAYALVGTTHIDLSKDPLGTDHDGQPVYLKDIWPTNQAIAEQVNTVITDEMYNKQYADVFTGDEIWQNMPTVNSKTYEWNSDSTYVQHPPYFIDMPEKPLGLSNINHASILALLGDSVTTDHISPAGNIKPDSPAGKYLRSHGVKITEFNSYGSRRGNHQVLLRGTFANIRIRNEMVPGTEGGITKYIPTDEILSIYDAAMLYQKNNTPLVVIAGKEYGTGSSRDWAAKGTLLLGVKAVIAESFERIHRSNLIGMGVLPLEFTQGDNRINLNLTGYEQISISNLTENFHPRKRLSAIINYPNGLSKPIELLTRIDTEDEMNYYKNGGILHVVLRQLANNNDS